VDVGVDAGVDVGVDVDVEKGDSVGEKESDSGFPMSLSYLRYQWFHLPVRVWPVA
jgi:hypothetical protein